MDGRPREVPAELSRCDPLQAFSYCLPVIWEGGFVLWGCCLLPSQPHRTQDCAGVCFLDGCPESKGKKLRLGFGAGRGPSCHYWRTAAECICILRLSSVNPGLPAWVRGPAQRGAINWGCGVEQVNGVSDNKDANSPGKPLLICECRQQSTRKGPSSPALGTTRETSKWSWGSKPVLNPRDTFCAKARVSQTRGVLVFFWVQQLNQISEK